MRDQFWMVTRVAFLIERTPPPCTGMEEWLPFTPTQELSWTTSKVAWHPVVYVRLRPRRILRVFILFGTVSFDCMVSMSKTSTVLALCHSGLEETQATLQEYPSQFTYLEKRLTTPYPYDGESLVKFSSNDIVEEASAGDRVSANITMYFCSPWRPMYL